jgi:hypothetical protein
LSLSVLGHARDTRELSLEAKVVELTDKLSAERERGCKERDSHVEAQRRLMEDERRRLLDSEARLREDLEVGQRRGRG